jgi:hypothetical protein
MTHTLLTLFGDHIKGGKAGRFDDASRGVIVGGDVRLKRGDPNGRRRSRRAGTTPAGHTPGRACRRGSSRRLRPPRRGGCAAHRRRRDLPVRHGWRTPGSDRVRPTAPPKSGRPPAPTMTRCLLVLAGRVYSRVRGPVPGQHHAVAAYRRCRAFRTFERTAEFTKSGFSIEPACRDGTVVPSLQTSHPPIAHRPVEQQLRSRRPGRATRGCRRPSPRILIRNPRT